MHLSKAHEDHLQDLLKKASVARDLLPYTEEFNTLKAEYYDRALKKLSDNEFWQALVTAAKKGGVRGKPREHLSPQFTPGQYEALGKMLPVPIGQRDQLPYAEKLDKLVKRFNDRFGTSYDHREIWLATLYLAK